MATKQEARELHDESFVFLAYMNSHVRFLPDGGLDYSVFFEKPPKSQGAMANLRRGGVDAAVISFGLNDPDLFPGRLGVARLFQHLGAFVKAIGDNAKETELARSVADMRRIRRAGKTAIVLHLTGVWLDGSIELLHAYRSLGVCSIHTPFDTRAHGRVDAWQRGSGLTRFGKDVIREMRRLGMVVDLAHASDRMFRQTLELVEGPVTVSHGLCRAISNTRRNLTDDQIRAVARTGGVVGIHFASQLIDDDYRRKQEASGFRKELREWEADLKRRFPDPFRYLARRYDAGRWSRSKAKSSQQSIERPPLSKLVDHVDRMVDLVGPDHVGLGPDYDLGNILTDLDRASKLPNLTRALLDRGYAKRDVRKILGGNFLRVYETILGR